MPCSNKSFVCCHRPSWTNTFTYVLVEAATDLLFAMLWMYMSAYVADYVAARRIAGELP
jgi:hypothetical protein